MPNPLIQRLKTFNQQQLEEIYKNCFMTDAGQLVLEDLKLKFFEYRPVSNKFEAGQQSMLFHLRNMLTPIVEDVNGQPGSSE